MNEFEPEPLLPYLRAGLVLASAAVPVLIPKPNAYTSMSVYGWRHTFVGEAIDIFVDAHLRFLFACAAFIQACIPFGASLGGWPGYALVITWCAWLAVSTSALAVFLLHRAVYGLPDPQAKKDPGDNFERIPNIILSAIVCISMTPILMVALIALVALDVLPYIFVMRIAYKLAA